MQAVEIKNLTKSFGNGKKKKLAIAGINLNIKSNQIFGLLGSNGAGKTTLLSILATTLSPSEGIAKIYGRDIEKESMKIRRIINVCSGYSGLFNELTSRENLVYYAKMRKIKDVEKKADELLKLVELEKQRDTVGADLSTGMRQRLSLAISLIGNPKLLLLDEPTVGLDPVIAHKIRKSIKKIQKKQKMTIILTTHNMHEAERLCDNIAIMKNGKMLAIKTVQGLREMLGNYQIINIETEKEIKTLKNKGVISIDKENNSTVIRIKDAKKNLPKIFDEIRKYKIVKMAMRELSLEELYLEFVK